MMIRLTALLVLTCATSLANASPTWHSGKITRVYPDGAGDHVILTFDTDSPSCTNANTPKYYYIRVGENGVTAEGLKNLLAVALAAAAANLPVTINFDSASYYCHISRLFVVYQ